MDSCRWKKNSLEIGMVVGHVILKMWGKYVINYSKDQNNMTERVELTKSNVLWYFPNNRKLNNDEKSDLTVQLTNVFDSDGIIIEETEEDCETKEEESHVISIGEEKSGKAGDQDNKPEANNYPVWILYYYIHLKKDRKWVIIPRKKIDTK